MIVVSICLSDIPTEARKKADNGKVYASFVVDERRDVDKFGNTHSVAINPTKEEREAKKPKIYVGNGKAYNFAGSSKTSNVAQIKDDPSDSLPF